MTVPSYLALLALDFILTISGLKKASQHVSNSLSVTTSNPRLLTPSNSRRLQMIWMVPFQFVLFRQVKLSLQDTSWDQE